MSTDGIVYMPLRNDDGTLAVLTDGPPAALGAFDISHQDIGNYGYLTASRSDADADDQISNLDSDIVFNLYVNPIVLEEDLDDDTRNDRFAINRTHALFFISSQDNPISIAFDQELLPGANLNVDALIQNATDKFGRFVANGQITNGNQIDEDVILTITPEQDGMGYYSVKYLNNHINHINGVLLSGETIKLYFESYLDESIETEIIMISKTGIPTTLSFLTPEVINVEIVFLFP